MVCEFNEGSLGHKWAIYRINVLYIRARPVSPIIQITSVLCYWITKSVTRSLQSGKHLSRLRFLLFLLTFDLYVLRIYEFLEILIRFFLLTLFVSKNSKCSIFANPECRCFSCCRVTVLALAWWRCRQLCVRRTQRYSDWRKSSRPQQAHRTTPSHRSVFRNKATSKNIPNVWS